MQAAWGRVGGLRTAARHDTREITAPARKAFEERFYRDLPTGLDDTKRERRAAAARRAYFAELTAKSLQSRRRGYAMPDASPRRKSSRRGSVRDQDNERT
jgi:hypothetical protein